MVVQVVGGMKIRGRMRLAMVLEGEDYIIGAQQYHSMCLDLLVIRGSQG